jgi:hypothetical protein
MRALGRRRVIAFICIAALFAIALAPAAAVPCLAVLVPLGPLFGTVAIDEWVAPYLIVSATDPFLEPTGSRPPPAL